MKMTILAAAAAFALTMSALPTVAATKGGERGDNHPSQAQQNSGSNNGGLCNMQRYRDFYPRYCP